MTKDSRKPSKKGIQVVQWDWNAKVGSMHTWTLEDIYVTYYSANGNEGGIRLIEFARVGRKTLRN